MPLILAAAMAWVLGSLVGFVGGAATPAILVAALLAIALVIFGRAPVAAALTLLALTSLQCSRELRTADEQCLARAARAATWEVTLRSPAAPGSFVRADLHDADDPRCLNTVSLAVRRGTAAAGSRVSIGRAEANGSDRGLLLREAELSMIEPPGPMNRWRNGVGAALDSAFGADGPMVRALLIADTRGLAPEIRDRYADAGLVHMLSISGLHVAIVGGALVLLLSSLRLSPLVAAGASVVLTAIYVVAIGAPPPAARSVTLFAATTVSRMTQRPTSPWGAFALGALIPLLEPRTVIDLGWQLSVSGYAAIIVAGRIGRRLPDRWRGWRASVARNVIAGLLTTLVTAPLVAWHFGRLSLIAPVSNLVAGPIISLLQPILFLTLIVPGAGAAAFVADAARPLMRAMDGVARIAASVPGAAIAVSPTAFVALLSGVTAGALLVAGWARHRSRPLTIAGSAFALMVWFPHGLSPRVQGAPVEIHMIDVGQGDAIALRSPRGRWILIDAGRSWLSGDAGRSTVVPYMRRRGGPLALLILTHPHADHIGGASTVLRSLRPPEVRDAAFLVGNEGYREVLQVARDVGSRWQRVRPGEIIDVDGIELTFLAPDSTWTASLDDPNEASTIVRVRYGTVRVLLTGDAELQEERWLLANARSALRADVLKVAHHGSATSSSDDFLDAVAPRLALVSVGNGNRYAHPSAMVMQRLVDRAVTVLRTDQLGTVVLRTDGVSIDAEAAGHRWRVTRPLPELP